MALMKSRCAHHLLLFAGLGGWTAFTEIATAQGTAFTYQGQLQNQGVPANGAYDLVFNLFDAPAKSNQIASVTNYSTSVSNGLFTATLDFGPGVFTGSNYWLDISVSPSGGVTPFFELSPRQPVTPAPYSLYAANAGVAGGVAPGATIQVQNLNVGLGNSVSGAYTTIAGGSSNRVTVDYAVVAGGFGNTASSNATFVGGGAGNIAANDGDVVVGGFGNIASEDPSFIGAGQGNRVGTFAGVGSTTFDINRWIGAGQTNNVQANWAGIGGGFYNIILTNAYYSFIGGGQNNLIQTNAIGSSIVGGINNTIQTTAGYAVIGGGIQNTIQNGNKDNVIAGGAGNTIQITANDNVIGGGDYNPIQQIVSQSVLGGGIANTIASLPGTTIVPMADVLGGGEENLITNAVAATLYGGAGNTVGANFATIPGGQQALVANYAQLAYSSGQFQAPGDSQSCIYQLRGITSPTPSTSNTQFLRLDGNTLQMALTPNHACAFSVPVLGMATSPNAHECCAFHFRGLASGAYGLVLNGAPEAYYIPSTFVPPLPVLSINSSGRLRIQVTGTAIDTIHWTATVATTEESY